MLKRGLFRKPNIPLEAEGSRPGSQAAIPEELCVACKGCKRRLNPLMCAPAAAIISA